jgi:hypothetical protein
MRFASSPKRISDYRRNGRPWRDHHAAAQRLARGQVKKRQVLASWNSVETTQAIIDIAKSLGVAVLDRHGWAREFEGAEA